MVTFGYVTNNKVFISTSEKPIDIKLDRVVAYDVTGGNYSISTTPKAITSDKVLAYDKGVLHKNLHDS